jgi:hypothetical protein
MEEIKVDAATAESLRWAATGARLIGPDGKLLGAYVPPPYEAMVERMLAEDLRRADDDAPAEVSPEELETALQAGEAIPMAEALKLVEKYGG